MELKDYLKQVTNKVNQNIEFFSYAGNEYRITTYKINREYGYELYRYNNILNKWVYQTGCDLFTTKERLFSGVKNVMAYQYNNL